MEPIESSETSAYNNTLTPGTYPKEKKLQEYITYRIKQKYTKQTTVYTTIKKTEPKELHYTTTLPSTSPNYTSLH